jgi:hypothetical protein
MWIERLLRSLTAALALVCVMPVAASAQTRPNHVKTVGPWEIVQWVRDTAVARCTLIRDKKPADGPGYGFLIDKQGLLLSVESGAWQLTPNTKVNATLTPADAKARSRTALPVSTARANIELKDDRTLLSELQRADRLDVQIGRVKVTLPFDDFNAARVVFESCVMTLGKTVSVAR